MDALRGQRITVVKGWHVVPVEGGYTLHKEERVEYARGAYGRHRSFGFWTSRELAERAASRLT